MSSPVVQRLVVVNDKDPEGLHVRPAGEFARLAMRFASEIEVVLDAIRADAKSVMHMLTLGVKPGMQLRLEARGADAEAAVDALARFIENGFVLDETGRPLGAGKRQAASGDDGQQPSPSAGSGSGKTK